MHNDAHSKPVRYVNPGRSKITWHFSSESRSFWSASRVGPGNRKRNPKLRAAWLRLDLDGAVVMPH